MKIRYKTIQLYIIILAEYKIKAILTKFDFDFSFVTH